jgi:hypothetical protein
MEARLRKLHPKMMKAIHEANGRHLFLTMGLNNSQGALFHIAVPTMYLIGALYYVKEFLFRYCSKGPLICPELLEYSIQDLISGTR